MEPESRGKNEARQLVQKMAGGRGGGVPFSEKAGVIISKRQPVSTKRGWQPARKSASQKLLPLSIIQRCHILITP